MGVHAVTLYKLTQQLHADNEKCAKASVPDWCLQCIVAQTRPSYNPFIILVLLLHCARIWVIEVTVWTRTEGWTVKHTTF